MSKITAEVQPDFSASQAALRPGDVLTSDTAKGMLASLDAVRAEAARASTDRAPVGFEPRHRAEPKVGAFALNTLKAVAKYTGITATLNLLSGETYRQRREARDQRQILARAAVYLHNLDMALAQPKFS